MTGGSPTYWGTGIPASQNSLTENPFNVIPQSHNPSDGEADIAANPCAPIAGGSGEPHSGRSNVAQFSSPTSYQGIIPDHLLDNREQFDDAPYVPPRLPQAELHSHPAFNPRVANSNAYDHDIQRYSYESGIGPSESSHSVESNWSNSSPSSTSSQPLLHDYLGEPTSQYPQPSLPHPTAYYPAYHGQHRLGLEHVRHGEQPSNTGGSYYRNHPQGYSMDGLLSPELIDDASARGTISSQLNYPASSSSSSAISATTRNPNVPTFSVSPTLNDGVRTLYPDAGPYLRQQLGLSAHEPVSLHSLPDPPPGEKPSIPLPMLIKLAIYGSPNKQLTLQEIYTELENRFQWFRDHKHERAWKNSIRHNLSLNKVFKNVPRPITEPGKGSYWQLDVSGGEGYKRARKRRPRNKVVASEEEDEEVSEMDEDRFSPLDLSHIAGPSRSSATPVDDAHIDPELRNEGHVVGEGRTRSATRRTGGGSPYPSQSPRCQHGPLPGQDVTAPAQPPVRFNQPSFGQPSFPVYPQTRAMTAVTASSPFAVLSSSPIAMAPSTSMAPHPQLEQVASYDRTAHVPQPLPPPRSGIEYVMDPGGLPAARRVRTFLESQGQVPADFEGGSPGSSSSGSSRTWNDARSRSETQG